MTPNRQGPQELHRFGIDLKRLNPLHWPWPKNQGRELPTFWQSNLIQEAGVLALLLLLFAASGALALGELRRRYIAVYQSEARKVELILSDQLEQAREQLIRFSQLPQAERNGRTALLLTDFSELYQLNDELSITEIIKRLPSSQVFPGFSLSRSALQSYLLHQHADSFSPLVRGVEDSRASIYIALPDPSGFLLGRLSLESLQLFLRQFSQSARTPVLLVARDGSVLLSSDHNLLIPAFPLDGAWKRQVVLEPLDLAGQRWIPIVTPASSVGAAIVTLVPTQRLADGQWMILAVLLTASAGSGILLLLKSLRMRRLFIQPIARLASEMRTLEAGGHGSAAADGEMRQTILPARFAELETIQSAFTAMEQAIREREQLLRQSEQQHRLLADNALDVIAICDPHGRPTYISPSIEKVRGWSVSEAMALPMDQQLSPEGCAFARQALQDTQDAIEHGLALPSFRTEMQQSHKNGSWIWTDVTSSCIVDAAGDYIGTLLVYRDITERKRLEHELLERATTDELTGLLNRRALMEQLEELLTHPDRRRGGEGLAVLFCDLDHFKEINDRLGHAAGDVVLRAVADRIRHCIRSGDLAARMGGDELIVVLRGVTALPSALAIAEKLSDSIARPITAEEVNARITASIGVTMAQPDEDADALLNRADVAMYHAKQAGRNQVTPLD